MTQRGSWFVLFGTLGADMPLRACHLLRRTGARHGSKLVYPLVSARSATAPWRTFAAATVAATLQVGAAGTPADAAYSARFADALVPARIAAE